MTKAKGVLGKPRIIIAFLVLVFLSVAVSGIAYGYLSICATAPEDKIMEGVRIGSLDVGGLQKEEALTVVQALADRALAQTVNLECQNRLWKISLAELGVETDLDAALEKAAEVGHAGSLWQRCQEAQAAKQVGKQIDLNYRVDQDRASAIITELTQELNTSPIDAGITVNERGELVTTFDKPGTRVNSEEAARELDSLLGRGVSASMNETMTIALKLVDKSPNITRDDLRGQKISGLLAAYTTRFQVSNVNRTYNVKVAAEAINHQLIKPGEVFSFNKVVGPRSQEAGYREALIIQQNEFVPGLGGGVCQVSSTLYNAVLLADLPVVERSNHSLSVDYVPAGRDATVAYGVIDLRFVNNTSGYLLLQAKVQGNSLTIQIFGDETHKSEVELASRVIARLEPVTIEKPNPELEEGQEVVEQEGKAGLQVQVYRTVKEQGQSRPAQLISTDTYKAVNRIIQVGTLIPAETPPGDGPTAPKPEEPTKPSAKPGTDPESEDPIEPSAKPGTDPESEDPTESPVEPVVNPKLTDQMELPVKPGNDHELADPTESLVEPGTDPDPADQPSEPIVNPEAADPTVKPDTESEPAHPPTESGPNNHKPSAKPDHDPTDPLSKPGSD